MAGFRYHEQLLAIGLLIMVIGGVSEASVKDYQSLLGNRIYKFGTIQLDPLYSQYGEGFVRNLTETIGSHLGLRYRIVSYSGNITGAWDNLVHTVANGEIDVGATLLTKTRCRQDLVSFSEPFLTSTLSVLYHGNRGVVRSPDELLSSGFTLGTLNHSAIADVMGDSTDTTIQEILNAVLRKDENLVHTVLEGVQRVRHSNYAFILDSVVAKFIAEQRPCALKTLELSKHRFQYGFITRKGASLLKYLSTAISELENTGVLPQMVKKLIYGRKECEQLR